MAYEEERMQILDMIERGQITAEQGLKLLQSLVSTESDEDEQVEAPTSPAAPLEAAPLHSVASASRATEPDYPVPAASALQDSPTMQAGEAQPETATESPVKTLPPDADRWRSFWMIPFWIGVVILIIGGVLMYQAQQASGLGFWFVLAGVPFILGLVIIILAWQSRTAPWLHIRVTQAKGERPEHIALSFPIPIRPTIWFLHTFGGRIPKVQEISLDKIMLAVDQSAKADNPIYIQVDEGDQGEKVEIFIG